MILSIFQISDFDNFVKYSKIQYLNAIGLFVKKISNEIIKKRSFHYHNFITAKTILL